jgi:hypothetical protein
MAPVLNKRQILEGPVHMYIGASAEADTPDVLPADTVAFGGTMGGTWRSVGYLHEDGVVVTFSTERGEVRSASTRGVILRPVTDYPDTVAGSFLEATLQNIRDAASRGEIAVVAAGAETPGHNELSMGGADDEPLAILLEGLAPPLEGGMPRRVFFPNVLGTADVELTQRIGEEGLNAGIPFEFTRVGDEAASTPVIRDITAPTGV